MFLNFDNYVGTFWSYVALVSVGTVPEQRNQNSQHYPKAVSKYLKVPPQKTPPETVLEENGCTFSKKQNEQIKITDEQN
eukprot:1158170-Amphidinium_carterae.1